MEVAPVGAVNTGGGVVPQPRTVGGVELLTVIPEGRLSVIEKFVRLVSPGAVMAILNLELPPAVMEAGEKDLLANISLPRTVTFAFAERRFPTPCSVVNAPAGMEFLNVPEGVPAGTVTGTEI